MRIETMGRVEFESANLDDGVPTIAVCVAYPTGRFHHVHTSGKGLLAVMHIRFADTDAEGNFCFPENKSTLRSTHPMTRGNALDILDFVAKYPQAERIVVACQGGVSRSRGVAAGLCAVLGLGDAHIYAEGQPNAHCKRQIIHAAEAAMRRLVTGWPVVHVLSAGQPLCGFSTAVPRDWPPGHAWVGEGDPAATCAACKLVASDPGYA